MTDQASKNPHLNAVKKKENKIKKENKANKIKEKKETWLLRFSQ